MYIDNKENTSGSKWAYILPAIFLISFFFDFGSGFGRNGLMQKLFTGLLFFVAAVLALVQLIKTRKQSKAWYKLPGNIITILFLIPFFYLGISDTYNSGMDLILDDKVDVELINSRVEEESGKNTKYYYLIGVDSNGEVQKFPLDKRHYNVFGNGGPKNVEYYNRSKVICKVTNI